MRILVIDPDEIWRRGFRYVAEEAGWEICAETSDSKAAPGLTIADRPDVIAIDTSYPITAIENLVSQHPGVGIVFFVSRVGGQDVRRFVREGARALVSKSDSREVIQQAVEAVFRAEPYFSPAASTLVLENRLNPSPHRRQDSFRATKSLTRRERDVVGLLAEGKGNRKIAEELGISVKTAENHRANAMRKLGSHSVGDLVRAAIEAGIIES